jgi:hypothetical protein
MHSTLLTQGASSLFTFAIALTLSCGRTQDSAPGPAATGSAAPLSEKTYHVKIAETIRLSLMSSGANTISIDLSSQDRTLEKPYPGKNYHQITGDYAPSELPSLCEPKIVSEANTFLNTILHPINIAHIGKVRINVSKAGGAPNAEAYLCFAVHTKSNKWEWHYDKVLIVVDSGVPNSPLSPPGTGHYEFSVDTDNVDTVAFIAGGEGGEIDDVTYTVISP